MPPNRVLCLGASPNQVPYLRALRARGFEVIATDRDPGAPGGACAHRLHAVAYDDLEGLRAVAEKEDLGPEDRIFTAAAQFAYERASLIARERGIPFPRPEHVDVCLDKTRLHAAFARHGVPVPPTRLFAHGELDPAAPPELEPGRVYFLKSDYGKSPRYCWRIDDGRLPALPERPDRWYRHRFLLQEAVHGTHFRLNLYAGCAATFLKFSDQVCVPVPSLGPGHGEVVARLRGLTGELGLERWLVKFDLVAGPEGWWALDLGLDPPLRLRLLHEYLDRDFADAYCAWLVEGDGSGLAAWEDLCRPVVIRHPAREPVVFHRLESAS